MPQSGGKNVKKFALIFQNDTAAFLPELFLAIYLLVVLHVLEIKDLRYYVHHWETRFLNINLKDVSEYRLYFRLERKKPSFILKRLGGIIDCKYKTSSWHINGFPYGSSIGSTV